MIQYIKPSCWAWILADLKRKEGTKERCIWGGYRYYIHRVYEVVNDVELRGWV